MCIKKCILVACEKHAAVLQTQVGGLVAIRSRQRVSERRSPEQVRTDPQAVGLKRSIDTRSCCKRKRKRDRPENVLGASKAEQISPKALGKPPLVATIGRGSQLLASPNSRKMGQDFSQNCYGQADICPDSLSGRHNGFVQSPHHFSEISRIVRYLHSRPFFQKIPDISTTAFPEIFGIFRESKYFGKTVPDIFGIFRENGGWLRFSRNIWNISGNWSLHKMKSLHLPDYGRGSPDRFG